MKIFIIGDPHFKTKNIVEIDIFHRKIQTILDEHTFSYIILLGDILHDHDRLHTIPLNKAYDFIRMCKSYTKTICLVGNHDMINNREFLTTNHWMNAMKDWGNVSIIDTPRSFENMFTCVPYVEPGRMKEALDLVGNWDQNKVIFAHQEIRGCKMGAIISEEGDEWLSQYPMLISGHIHDNQWVGENVYYPGSCIQHSFGDSSKKVVAIYDTDTNTIEEVRISTVKKKTLYKTMSELKKMKTDDWTDTIKIVVEGERAEFTNFKKTKKYKELMKENIKIEYKYKHVPQDIPEHVNFDMILHEKVTQKHNELLSADYKKLIQNK